MSRPLADRATRVAARALFSLPRPVHRLLAGRPIVIDGQELDVEAQLGTRLLKLTVGKTFEELPLEEGRAQIESETYAFGDELPLETVRDLRIPGPAGDLPARLYRPDGIEGPSAALVYFHGGGWVLGDLSAADSVSRMLAEHARLTVISIDYRLAPEHPFPAGVEDAIAAFGHVVEHAADYDVDPAAVGVGGESAGGNLAAVVAQQAALGVGPAPAFQLLFMPVTDLSTKHESYRLFGEGFFLTEAQMDWYRERYLTDPAQSADPRVSPLLAEDVSGVAPAYVAVAGFDPLRDEGEAYAAKLAAAGVPVTLRRHSGIFHGLVNATGVSAAARRVLLEAAGALQVGLTSKAAGDSR